ncbi:MAG TPA: hypothetical protein VHO07_17225 [Streptosporangiaceae bacterium]|nr:hypothetical protein [Streptosporangiaceae bacterium]
MALDSERAQSPFGNGRAGRPVKPHVSNRLDCPVNFQPLASPVATWPGARIAKVKD